MKKMNNKGFSLVELIIVIAIMAILLVVLAPQYLKYVEKSRNSTDLQNAAEFVSAIQIYASDPDSTVSPTAAGATLTINNASQTVSDPFWKEALIEAGLADSSGKLETRCQSKTAWQTYSIKYEIPSGGVGLKFTYSATGEATAGTFAARMAGATSATPATP